LAVSLDPGRRILHRGRDQPAVLLTTGSASLDQPRALENREVLRHRRQRHRERLREFSDECFPSREPRDDQPASGVGERGKDRVERLGATIVNHVVNY
jgi:hypothetical protein